MDKIIAAVIIAALSSYVTLLLSTKKRKSEWWWDKKCQAYDKIISDIETCLLACDEIIIKMTNGIPISDEELNNYLLNKSKVRYLYNGFSLYINEEVIENNVKNITSLSIEPKLKDQVAYELEHDALTSLGCDLKYKATEELSAKKWFM